MSVHPNGSGTGWQEAVDVNQPHGLDYRSLNDLRIGVRKRLSQEHIAFSDATVGGQHTPGGAGVLLLETTANMTTLGAAADLTSAHEFGIACNTDSDPTGATLFYFGDDTIPVTLPVSWNNILTDITHTFGTRSEITIGVPVIFEQSVAFVGDISMDGDLGIGGDFSVDGTVDFAGDVHFAADISVDGTVDFAADVAFVSDVSVDGYIKADATTSAFGAGTGIELYFDPTVCVGESNTSTDSIVSFPGGLKLVWGDTSSMSNSQTVVVAHGLTKCFKGWAQPYLAATGSGCVNVSAIDDTNLTVSNRTGSTTVCNWFAIGR